MTRPQPVRRKLLATLHDTGGVADRSGRATSVLAEAMGYTSRPVSLSPLLSALEEDGLVQREVRGRRCFRIELTAKGRALVELDEGLDSRRIGPATSADDGAPDGPDAADEADAGEGATAASGEPIDAPAELLRRQLGDVLMELGALKHRVAALERRLESGRSDEPGQLTPRRGRAS